METNRLFPMSNNNYKIKTKNRSLLVSGFHSRCSSCLCQEHALTAVFRTIKNAVFLYKLLHLLNFSRNSFNSLRTVKASTTRFCQIR